MPRTTPRPNITMNPKIELKQLDAERATLLTKASGSEKGEATWTAKDSERATWVLDRITELSEYLEKQDAANAALKAAGLGVTSYASSSQQAIDAGLVGEDDDDAQFLPTSKTLGKTASERVAGFTKAFGKAIRGADPMVGGVSKALVPTGSVTIAYDGPLVVEPRPAFWIASACTPVNVDNPTGAFLRQNLRTNNATTVPLGGDKPESKYGFELADWKVATLAHLSEPIARQWLADFSGLLPALSGELGFGVATALDTFILQGGTAEDGTTVTGLLNTPEVATTAFAVDALVTLRHAIGELELDGVEATAVVLHPNDWMAIELLREETASGKYLLSTGPNERAARSVWSTPVILASGIPQGTALAADFSTVGLLKRGDYSITWTEQGIYTEGTGEDVVVRDLYATNKVRFRAEARYGIQLVQPQAIRKINLKA